jgi:hypothetical protein
MARAADRRGSTPPRDDPQYSVKPSGVRGAHVQEFCLRQDCDADAKLPSEQAARVHTGR